VLGNIHFWLCLSIKLIYEASICIFNKKELIFRPLIIIICTHLDMWKPSVKIRGSFICSLAEFVNCSEKRMSVVSVVSLILDFGTDLCWIFWDLRLICAGSL
jgi:hypothetical protein